MVSCQNSNPLEIKYSESDPVIIKKEYSIIPGVCIFTYEGWGKKETFEDDCAKYSVGEKLVKE